MLIPYVTLKDPRAAIALYEKALGASNRMIMDGPGGMVMHAEVEIAGQRFMLSGEWPGMATAPDGRSPVNFMLYVDNVDESLQQATDAGMAVVSEPETMFWGDRTARASDGHGYEWTFAQQVEEVGEAEMQKRAKAFADSMSGS